MATMEPPGIIPFQIHNDATTLTLPRPQSVLMRCPHFSLQSPPEAIVASRLFQRGSLPDGPGPGRSKPHLPGMGSGLRSPLSPGQAASLLLPVAAPSREGINPGNPPHGLQGDRDNTRYLRLWKVEHITHVPAPSLTVEKGRGPRRQRQKDGATCVLSAYPPPRTCFCLASAHDDRWGDKRSTV